MKISFYIKKKDGNIDKIFVSEKQIIDDFIRSSMLDLEEKKSILSNIAKVLYEKCFLQNFCKVSIEDLKKDKKNGNN